MAGTYSRREALEILGAAAFAAPMVAVLGGCSNGGSAATTATTGAAASSGNTSTASESWTPTALRNGESFWYVMDKRPAKDATFDALHFHDGKVDRVHGMSAYDETAASPLVWFKVTDMQGMSDADVLAKCMAACDASLAADKQDGGDYVTDVSFGIYGETDSTGNHVSSESLRTDPATGKVHRIADPPTQYSDSFEHDKLSFSYYFSGPCGTYNVLDMWFAGWGVSNYKGESIGYLVRRYDSEDAAMTATFNTDTDPKADGLTISDK
ncbi:MAG: hypothetical protein LKE37_04105 [Atopobiaceae bacterium]|jgi:hypothetical protein|nr:hypothetical protein [Atopobiaceae bacterium]